MLCTTITNNKNQYLANVNNKCSTTRTRMCWWMLMTHCEINFLNYMGGVLRSRSSDVWMSKCMFFITLANILMQMAYTLLPPIYTHTIEHTLPLVFLLEGHISKKPI